MTQPVDWDHQSICMEGDCIQPATHRRLVSIEGDGISPEGTGSVVYEMICCEHADGA